MNPAASISNIIERALQNFTVRHFIILAIAVPLSIFNHVPIVNQLIDGFIYISCKIEGWNYPDKATRKAALNERGFIRLHELRNSVL